MILPLDDYVKFGKIDISEDTLRMLVDLPNVRLLDIRELCSNIRNSLKSYASGKNYDIVIK